MQAISLGSKVSVELIDGQPSTTSLDVATHFGKRHDDVLKRLRSLECSPEFTLRNFAECSRQGANNKREPYFRMTRDGFTFLCMGFTGKEAAKWKEAYINAFNQLEKVALQNPAPAQSEMVLEHRAFRGRNVLIANFGGQPWFAAGNLCSALGLGSSDRLTRSLPADMKRRLQRSGRQLWLIDSRGAARAIDYCKPEVAAGYRDWLRTVVPESARIEAEIVKFPARPAPLPAAEPLLVDTPEAAFAYNPRVDPLSIDDVMNCGLSRSLAVLRLLMGDLNDRGEFTSRAPTIGDALWMLEGQLEQLHRFVANYRKGAVA